MNEVSDIKIWIGFSVFLIIALSVDTFILQKSFKRPHQSMRASVLWTLVWVFLALLFNALLWFYYYSTATLALANTKALTFLTGYLIEKSLSVDNLFVFLVIFSHFRITPAFQQRVFTYGIWSAIVMRLLLILAGYWLISRFHWVLYLMGIFLFLTGLKMLLLKEKEKDLAETTLLKIIKRFFRVTTDLHGEAFFIIKNGLRYATPLFIALIFIEISDLIFAFDSIPAIFTITQDPFIIWSSNIFAILGLRALYFLLSGMLLRFHYLKYGIACILVFIGGKMLIEPWFNIPVGVSLSMVISILVLSTCLSVYKR